MFHLQPLYAQASFDLSVLLDTVRCSLKEKKDSRESCRRRYQRFDMVAQLRLRLRTQVRLLGTLRHKWVIPIPRSLSPWRTRQATKASRSPRHRPSNDQGDTVDDSIESRRPPRDDLRPALRCLLRGESRGTPSQRRPPRRKRDPRQHPVPGTKRLRGGCLLARLRLSR